MPLIDPHYNLDKLDKNKLYILSVSSVPNGSRFTKLIKDVTKYVKKEDGFKEKETVTHTALLVNCLDSLKWKICEVSYNGEVNSEFTFKKGCKYYVTEVGEITPVERLKLINVRYKNKDIVTVVGLLVHYSFVKAFASLELPEKYFVFRVVNRIMDFIRDVYEAILTLFGIPVPIYCTESVLTAIGELNSDRDVELVLSKELRKLISEQGFRFYEIYPQNILENSSYSEFLPK